MRTLIATFAVLAAISGCGGDGGDPAALPTRTPPPEAEPTARASLDVKAINAARDEFVAACREREREPTGETMSQLRTAARELDAAFEADPDTPFRRSANTEAVTMRERLRSLALLARRECGGGAALRVGERLARVAARDAG